MWKQNRIKQAIFKWLPTLCPLAEEHNGFDCTQKMRRMDVLFTVSVPCSIVNNLNVNFTTVTNAWNPYKQTPHYERQIHTSRRNHITYTSTFSELEFEHRYQHTISSISTVAATITIVITSMGKIDVQSVCMLIHIDTSLECSGKKASQPASHEATTLSFHCFYYRKTFSLFVARCRLVYASFCESNPT